MTRFFVRLLNFTLVACFLGSVWGGWYLSKQGFGQKWRKKLSEEFAKRGVQMTTRRLTLDPLRGLVARDVKVFSNSRGNQVIATINELRLDIDYTRLLRNEPFLDALSLSEGEVNLDLDPRHKNSGELAIHHLEARFYFAADHLEIRQFQGVGLGLRFSVSGTLEHGPAWQISTDPTNLWKRFSSMPQPWLARLEELRFVESLGHLDVSFRGDLTLDSWLKSAEIKMAYPRVRWRGAEFDNLELAADFGAGDLSIRRLTWRDDRGSASLDGTWRPGAKGDFHLRFAADATPLLQQIPPFDALSIDGATQCVTDFSWSEKPVFQWRALGHLDFADVLCRGVKWSRAQARFSISPERWLLQDLQLTQNDGLISGQILHDRDGIKIALTSTVEPQSIWQSLAIHVPPMLGEAEFPVSPLIKWEASGPPSDFSKWQIGGEIILGRTHLRGVALTSAQASFSAIGSFLSLQNVQITRPEGQFSGEISWDSATGDLLFWNVKDSIDLVVIGLWMGSPWAEALESMRLGKGAILESGGRFHWSGDTLSNAELRVEAILGETAPLVLQSLFKQLPEIEKPARLQASVTLTGDQLEFSPLRVEDKNWRLEGRTVWKLEGSFLGEMEWSPLDSSASTQSWSANGSWNRVVWKEK